MSVLVAFGFIAVAVIGPASEGAEALDWDDVVIIGSSAAAGAALGAAVGDGLGAVAGAAGGAIIGAFLASSIEDNGDAALSGAVSSYANSLATNLMNNIEFAETATQNQITTFDLAEYYFIRKAEWAALQLYDEQTANGESYVYDADYVLSESEVANGTLSYTWMATQFLDAAFQPYENIAQSFTGTYADMSWSSYTAWSGGYQVTASTISSLSTRSIRFGAYVPSSSSTYVMLSSNTTLYMISTSTDSVTLTMTITYPNGTTALTSSETVSGTAGAVVPVELNGTGLESGRYQVYYTASGNKGFCFADVIGESYTASNSLYAARVDFVKSGDSVICDGLGYYDGSSYMWLKPSAGSSAGSTVTSHYMGFSTTTSYSGINASYQINELTCLETLQELIDQVASVYTTANAYAQTYYNMLVLNGGDNRIMPDIIFPDVGQLDDLTADQIYALYLAYLEQCYSWFESNAGVLDWTGVNISSESLSLKCLGSITRNGTVLAGSDTIFTPYISLDDMTLSIGDNVMTQSGFAILWGNATTLEGNYSIMDGITYLPLKAGDVINITYMMEDGTYVTTITLTVTEVTYVIPDLITPASPAQSMTDAEWIAAHWYYLAVAGGVICLMAAMATRNSPVLIAGIALIAAGGVGWYLAGDTTLLSILDMAPDKLTAWIQNLR